MSLYNIRVVFILQLVLIFCHVRLVLVLFCYKPPRFRRRPDEARPTWSRSAREPYRRLVESSPEKSRASRRFRRPPDRKPGITVEHGGYTPPHEAAGTKQTDVGSWVLRTQHHSSETVVVLAARSDADSNTRRESETEEEVAGAEATLADELGFS